MHSWSQTGRAARPLRASAFHSASAAQLYLMTRLMTKSKESKEWQWPLRASAFFPPTMSQLLANPILRKRISHDNHLIGSFQPSHLRCCLPISSHDSIQTVALVTMWCQLSSWPNQRLIQRYWPKRVASGLWGHQPFHRVSCLPISWPDPHVWAMYWSRAAPQSTEPVEDISVLMLACHMSTHPKYMSASRSDGQSTERDQRHTSACLACHDKTLWC